MQEQRSPESSGYRNDFSDSNARPGRVLDNPAVNHRFFGPDESLTGPERFRFDPRGARARAKDVARYSRYRNRAVWAQALVLFNVVGVPLSQGVYLEYYYNSVLGTSSLIPLAAIPGLQVLCILATPLLVGWLYHRRGQRSGWRLTFFVASLVAVCAQLALQWIKKYILLLILQGLLLGISLGTLFTLSTLVLSSHYRFNLPLVSTQSGFMGFLGAVVYSIVADLGLQGHKTIAPAATAGILGATLLAANFLIRRVDQDTSFQTPQLSMTLPSRPITILKEKGTLPFVLGYILIFFGLLTFPIYIVLILPSSTGTWTIITTLATAALSACLSANPSIRRRLGPVNTFIAAAMSAGAVSILPFWMPYTWLSILAGGLYGIGLGAIVALHIKVSTVFHKEKAVWATDMPARAAMLMALAGMSTFGGLVVSAVLMEMMRNGGRIASCVAAGCLVGGGVLVAAARWRRCARLWVAI